ncbi:MAG: glycosyltransferase family 4 protein [Caulobacteraceae bacterium]|nr:glycosyltransferase family 4 protein [Caulobacteraceae bacterium]
MSTPSDSAGIAGARPRIWYIYPPAGGPGLGRYWRAYLLSRAWRALGLESLVIAPGYHHQFQNLEPREGFQDVGGAPHYFLPTPPYGKSPVARILAMLRIIPDLLGNPALRVLGRAAPPEVVVYSSPYPFGVIAGWMLARKYKARFIFEVRDIWPLSLTEILGTPSWHPFVLLAGFCERFAYKTADRVVSLLADADQHMTTRGMSADKFCYIPNGVQVISEEGDIGPAATHPLVLHIKALREAGEVVVIHAGNMGATTPLGPLLQAADLIRESGADNIRFILVGRGELEPALRDQAAALSLTSVEFHDQVERAVVMECCRHADVGFASSPDLPIYRFGVSPNKIYDYMLAGLPIVYANTREENHITATGGAIGCSVDDPEQIAASLVAMISMPEADRRAIGDRGRRHVLLNHDYSILARRYADLMGLTSENPTVNGDLPT